MNDILDTACPAAPTMSLHSSEQVLVFVSDPVSSQKTDGQIDR